MTLVHYIGDEHDDNLWLRASNRTLIDLSSGYTLTAKITDLQLTTLVTKASGVTGATGAGNEPDGTPNVVVAYTTSELNALTAGSYILQVQARRNSDSKDLIWQIPWQLKQAGS